MDIGQLRVGKGYIMVTVGQQGQLKENLTELHIIVRTTGLFMDWKILQIKDYLAPVVDATKQLDPQDCYLPATEIFLNNEWWYKM